MEKPVFGNSEKNVVEFIAKNIGGSGYGAFWQSSVVSYYSDFKTPIYPVLIGRDAEFITPYSMLVKKQWYVEKNKHFIVEKIGNNFIDNTAMFRILGKPDQIYEVSDYTIYYWKKDISNYVRPYEQIYKSSDSENYF